jgi:UDP-N-acetylglucosamine 2-epimerase (non-hydrolysing)
VFPVHLNPVVGDPARAILGAHPRAHLVRPLDYASIVRAMQAATLILTDSGGVQEEACILKVPCVTLRENTERPETVEVGANMVAGRRLSSVLAASRTMLAKVPDWANPFGDGRSGERIANFVMKQG